MRQKIQSYVMLVQPNVTIEPSNMRKKNKGTIKCDKSTVTCDVDTAQYCYKLMGKTHP